MSEVKLNLRPPPNVDFVIGYPGIPPGRERPQAAVKGTIEFRVPAQGVEAKWVRIELRKVEKLPGAGAANTFYDFIGPGPITLWSAPEEYTLLHSRDFPFAIRIPESIPPTVSLGSAAGIGYELVASICTKAKKGFLRKVKSVIVSTISPITIDKHELHSTWPVYCQPETRYIAQDGVNLSAQRSNTCYGPGDLISVTVVVKSANLHTIILRTLELSLRETTVFRAGILGSGKKSAPQEKHVNVAEGKRAVDVTLYGGSSYTAEISCMVSPGHTTPTLNAARHIDVTYALCIKALLDTARPVLLELPVIISNWQRAVSCEAVNRIGPAPNLSLLTEVAISGSTDPTWAGPADAVAIVNRANIFNTSRHAYNPFSNALGNDYSTRLASSSTRHPSDDGTTHGGRFDTMATSSTAQRPNSYESNRLTITNARPQPINTTWNSQQSWSSSEEEKLKLYEKARDQILQRVAATSPPAIHPQLKTATTPRIANSAAISPIKTNWMEAEEEKLRLLQQTQAASTALPPTHAELEFNPSLQYRFSLGGNGTKPLSAAAALYTQAINAQNRSAPGAGPPASNPTTLWGSASGSNSGEQRDSNITDYVSIRPKSRSRPPSTHRQTRSDLYPQPSPSEESFRTPYNVRNPSPSSSPSRPVLPPLASNSSPAGPSYAWNCSTNSIHSFGSGPLSPALLAGPQLATDQAHTPFDQSNFRTGFTPRTSLIPRTGVTPLVGSFPQSPTDFLGAKNNNLPANNSSATNQPFQDSSYMTRREERAQAGSAMANPKPNDPDIQTSGRHSTKHESYDISPFLERPPGDRPNINDDVDDADRWLPFDTLAFSQTHLKERLKRAYEANDTGTNAPPPAYSQYTSSPEEEEALRRTDTAQAKSALVRRPLPRVIDVVKANSVGNEGTSSSGPSPNTNATFRLMPFPPAAGTSRVLTAAEEKSLLRAKFDAGNASVNSTLTFLTQGYNSASPTMASTLPPLMSLSADESPDGHEEVKASFDRHRMHEEKYSSSKHPQFLQPGPHNEIITTQVIFAAEGALRHVGNLERKAQIKAAFQDLQIPESEYHVLAGFNEALIQSGFGYLEEIHILCYVEILNSTLLLSKLGKVLTPYPGIIFTPSSGYKTPVFKDDGTIWDYHDLTLHLAERHSDIRAKGILHSDLNAFTSLAESQPGISVAVSGCPVDGGNNNHNGTREDRGQGHPDDDHTDNHERSNKPEDDSDPDDPDPDDPGKEDSVMPSISFEVQANLFKGTGSSPSSKPFQVLEINGTLVVQTIPAQLKPKRLSESRVEFRKLNFQGSESAGLAYEQVHVRVEINTKDKNTKIDVRQPLKTPAFHQETKEIIAEKMSTSGTLGGSVGIKPTATTLSISGSRSKEASSSTERTKYHSRITEWHSGGVVSWGFSVDDVNERQTGIEFGRVHALPSADFKFYGVSDVGPPPPPPERFEVLVTSCWSLISPGSEGSTTSGWFSWFKGIGSEAATSKLPLYSNLCQLAILEAPSDLSQESLYRSTSEVTPSSSKTIVERQGLHKITPAVLFLDGPPIKSGDSYGAVSPSLRR